MGFRTNLKAQLVARKLRVKDLADRSGVKKSTLDSYLREKGYLPSSEAAVRIAAALGVSVEYLVTGHDSRPEPLPPPLDPDVARLAEAIEDLGGDDRQIVVDAAVHLAAALRKRAGG